MKGINRLGFTIAGLTAIALFIVFGLYWGGRKLVKNFYAQPSPSLQPLSSSEAIKTDSDHDGLPDIYENIYRTDPQKADTDGDGVNDLQEITQGRDPLVPGPNDESRPPTGRNVKDTTTSTGKYLAQLPEDIPREEILKRERLEAFVNVNKGELLPIIGDSDIVKTQAAGKSAIEAYLNSISPAQNKDLKAVTNQDIEKALRDRLNTPNSSTLAEIIKTLENNLAIIKKVSAPAETVELHKKYLAASQALIDNVKILNTVAEGDFVAGLIAAKKIEDLASVFQEISDQVKQLETKYQLK